MKIHIELHQKQAGDYGSSAWEKYPKNFQIPRIGETVVYHGLNGIVTNVKYVTLGNNHTIEIILKPKIKK